MTRFSHSLSLRLPPLRELTPTFQGIRSSSGVNLAGQRKSQAHYAKGMQSPKPCGSGSYSLWAHDFRFFFTPLPGFFSPFPRGTGSLSVTDTYLALEGGPPSFRRGFTCPVLLGNTGRVKG